MRNHFALTFTSSILFLISSQAFARNEAVQSHVELQKTAYSFLQQHATSLAGEALIKVSPPNPQLRLAECKSIYAFLPSSSKLWGRMNIGLRCKSGASWQVYLQAELTIKSDYVVSKFALPFGHTISPEDLQSIHAELPQYSPGILLKSEQLVGKILNAPIAAGVAIRQENVKAPVVVAQGQNVKIYSKGNGFQISSEGISLNQASEGQLVRVKVASGQVIQGYASVDGIVEIKLK